jgi:integrase
VLHVRDTRVVVNGRAEDSDGKTDAGWRTISLDDFTFEELSRYIDMIHKEAKDFGKSYPKHGKLVVWLNGVRVHPDTITRRFNRLVDLAGVPKIELHDIRHVYITLARDHGVNRKILADRVGHANETVTDAIYTHKSTGHDREMADQMGGLIRDAVKRVAA